MLLLSSSHQPSTLNHQLLPLHPPGSHRAKAIAAMDDEIEIAVLRQLDEITLDGFHDWRFSRSGVRFRRMSVIWDLYPGAQLRECRPLALRVLADRKILLDLDHLLHVLVQRVPRHGIADRLRRPRG